MDYDFGNSDFPGMYSADNNKKNNDSDFGNEKNEKLSEKDLLIVKRKDKKDKGYATLEGESSPEDEIEAKSPLKSRKTKTFKFSSKKEKREKSREKENKELEKDKKKEKDKQKVKVKDKKKVKNVEPTLDISEELPIFGVPLSMAVQRNPCHDGLKIPLVIRNCIDYVQEHGLQTEGIYKMSGVKSRVQHVYGLYNKRKTVYESDFDITIATSLLKQFLRLLPEPILTNSLLNKFDDPVATENAGSVKTLLEQLPECNQDMLRWLLTHFRHVCLNERNNKMNATLLGQIFCPLLQINARLFTNLISWSEELFPNTTLSRYVPPLRCVSPNMPTTLEAVTVELSKQESLLGQIHFEMNSGFISKEKEDELWGIQRNITNLKRKLKSLEREMQQKFVKMQESSVDIDKDDDAETATNVSDNSSSMVTEKCVDTTPSANESLDKKINYESSQENLNQHTSEDSEDEEKGLEFESSELISLVRTLQEEIKTERLKINQLKAELHASKLETNIIGYLTGVSEDLCDDGNNTEGIREYNNLQVQKKNLLRSIMEEREMIIDLKIQIRMAQHKYKQTTNIH